MYIIGTCRGERAGRVTRRGTQASWSFPSSRGRVSAWVGGEGVAVSRPRCRDKSEMGAHRAARPRGSQRRAHRGLLALDREDTRRSRFQGRLRIPEKVVEADARNALQAIEWQPPKADGHQSRALACSTVVGAILRLPILGTLCSAAVSMKLSCLPVASNTWSEFIGGAAAWSRSVTVSGIRLHIIEPD